MRPESTPSARWKPTLPEKRTMTASGFVTGFTPLSAMCCSCPTATIRTNTIAHRRAARLHLRALNDWEKAAFNRLYDQYYYHRHNEFWREQAMNKLPQLTQSTRMLVCGEDLGMIPGCVAWVMNDLRILSLEIQRMPKDPTTGVRTSGLVSVSLCLPPYPHTICPPCAAGGKKTSNRRSVTTTPCSGTTVPHRQRPRRSSAKKWFAITSIATPSSASSPCKTGCP